MTESMIKPSHRVSERYFKNAQCLIWSGLGSSLILAVIEGFWPLSDLKFFLGFHVDAPASGPWHGTTVTGTVFPKPVLWGG